MLFPKYNQEYTNQKNNIIQRIADRFPNINIGLLWLYPYYKSCGSSYKDSILMLDGTSLIFSGWSDEDAKNPQTACFNRGNYRFFVDKQYIMTEETDYVGSVPTQTEFEFFCLQNNLDTTQIKLYDEQEINNQLLMFAESVGIHEDILESWRL